MLFSNYKQRVDKHLAIFNRAIEGLRQVQEDMNKEMGDLHAESAELFAQIERNKARKDELATHHGEVGSTIQKILQIFPAKGASK